MFRQWLEGSDVEGIPAAVRRRVGIDAEAFGVEAATVVRDWVPLLVSHGTEADLVWLGEVGGAEVETAGYATMMASGHPAALDLARRVVDGRYDTAPDSLRSRYSVGLAFGLLAKRDPACARDRLSEEIDRLGTGDPLALPLHQALPQYATALTEADIEAGYAPVVGAYRFGLQHDVGMLGAAWMAAHVLAEAGRDVAPLGEILAWPAEYVLDAAARGGVLREGHRWETALRLLERPRSAWTDEEVAALEAALPHVSGSRRLRLWKTLEQAKRQ